uniref:phosphatidyl-N-methylethanolamine N-methyltransferase n=1 Tax=Timspurckia oligopyrenoides TaxID=708627 RepID=A0A7S0ZLY2_9RHOD|mmetsp:Transcript_9692/g.17468  ORF Transcript_9692/g.17468 Transcript_9692/m.17468 type:complete len:203 (+) Transcript_9692:35-643(+)
MIMSAMSKSISIGYISQPIEAYALTIALFLCAALPHIFYYVVWTNPKRYQSLIQKAFAHKVHPVDAFASTASAFKLIQLIALITWTILVLGYPIPLPQIEFMIAGSALLVIGQVLNVSIYTAIGKAGVYYGVRLGKSVPWCSGFPFNVVSHPQYVGSVLTVWAVLLPLWSSARGNPLQSVITWLIPFWTCLYVFSAFVEEWM